MTLTFTNKSITKTATLVPGTFTSRDTHIDAGGDGFLPFIRTNLGRAGSCEVVLDSSSFTAADACSLISSTGEACATVSAPANCVDALIDVTLKGEGVQTAIISWNGIPAADND